MTTSKTIKREIARATGVAVEDLEGGCRRTIVTRARQWAMYRLRHETLQGSKSLEWVGRQLGGRDHSTVHHGVRAHARRVGHPESHHG